MTKRILIAGFIIALIFVGIGEITPFAIMIAGAMAIITIAGGNRRTAEVKLQNGDRSEKVKKSAKDFNVTCSECGTVNNFKKGTASGKCSKCADTFSFIYQKR